MNQKQRVAIWIGFTLIIATGVYPPWIQSWDPFGASKEQILLKPTASGYSWIFQPPGVPRWVENYTTRKPDEADPFLALRIAGFWTNQIDLARLGIEWAIIAAGLAAALLTLGTPKPSPTPDSSQDK